MLRQHHLQKTHVRDRVGSSKPMQEQQQKSGRIDPITTYLLPWRGTNLVIVTHTNIRYDFAQITSEMWCSAAPRSKTIFCFTDCLYFVIYSIFLAAAGHCCTKFKVAQGSNALDVPVNLAVCPCGLGKPISPSAKSRKGFIGSLGQLYSCSAPAVLSDWAKLGYSRSAPDPSWLEVFT
jgi:hypothetical protein